MGIVRIQIGQAGGPDVLPKINYITTTDTETTILTANYLNSAVAEGYSFNSGDMCLVSTQSTQSSLTPTSGWYQVSRSGNNYSLVVTTAPGDVVLPTIANHLAYFTDINGTLSNAAANVINAGNISAGLSGTAGTLASFPGTAAKGSLIVTGVANTGNTNVTISNAAHGQATVYSIPDSGATTANFIVSKTTGTQHVTVGSLQVDAGDITVGLSTGGTAGRFISFSATTTNGSLVVAHVGNAGNFNTTINSAATLGQSQVVTIPDGLGATSRFVVATSAALVGGNLLKNSGTAGAVVDAGIIATQVQLNTLIHAVQVTGLGGGGAGAVTVTAAGCTSSSIVMFQIATSSNLVSVAKVVAGTGSFTVLCTADPGAVLTGQYILFLGAQ